MSDVQAAFEGQTAAPTNGVEAAFMGKPMAAPKFDLTQFEAALKEMKLTPEEQALYMRHLENVKGPGGVDNPDGTRSTLKQMTVEVDGRHFSVPTLWDGKVLDPHKPEEFKQIIANVESRGGWDKFPSYSSADEAEARYEALHRYMERDITP